jgi:hypothetical protein
MRRPRQARRRHALAPSRKAVPRDDPASVRRFWRHDKCRDILATFRGARRATPGAATPHACGVSWMVTLLVTRCGAAHIGPAPRQVLPALAANSRCRAERPDVSAGGDLRQGLQRSARYSFTPPWRRVYNRTRLQILRPHGQFISPSHAWHPRHARCNPNPPQQHQGRACDYARPFACPSAGGVAAKSP